MAVSSDIAANKLFVNIPGNCWYRDGVPGIGDCIESAAEGIRIIMQEIAPRSVMCIGNSMGAYAALLFGTLVNAGHVLAFGPETLLRLPTAGAGPLSATGRPPLRRPAPPSQPARRGRKTDIIFGESDLVDVHCARRIVHLDGVQVRSLRGVGHEVPAMLHRFDAWRPLIEGMSAMACCRRCCRWKAGCSRSATRRRPWLKDGGFGWPG